MSRLNLYCGNFLVGIVIVVIAIQFFLRDDGVFEVSRVKQSLQDEQTDSESNSKITWKYKHWFGSKTTPVKIKPKYIINPKRLCPKYELDYLFVVKSASHYGDKRFQIRSQLWEANLSGRINVRVLFVLGVSPHYSNRQEVENESEKYGDVLLADFMDTYHNLTIKGVVALRWVAEFCPHVKYIIKMDDDVEVDISHLTQMLVPQFSHTGRHIACHENPSGEIIWRTVDGEDTKWSVPPDEFPDLEFYPFDFCYGYFVVLTRHVIKPMLEATQVVPYFWIDDVYLYGLVRLTAGNLSIHNLVDDIRSYATFSGDW